MSYKIGLLFEAENDINLPSSQTSIDFLYHWRETEEIEAIKNTLLKLGHDVVLIGNINNLLTCWKEYNLPDLIWNLSVGVISRNRTTISPALLEQLQIPYTGGDATSKCITLNKQYLKSYLFQLDILTPNWKLLNVSDDFQEIPWNPLILKPVSEGYSIGVKKFSSFKSEEIKKHVHLIKQQLNCPTLCEEFIGGREITIAIIEGLSEYGAIEVQPTGNSAMLDQIVSLKSKKNGVLKKVVVDPQDEACSSAYQIAKKVMEKLEIADYATFDFRVSREGKVFLIDVNADATLHPDRSLAMAFRNQGVSYKKVISSILNNVTKRFGLEVKV